MESRPKYFLYARKSTDEAYRQVLSIEAQLCEVRELARREDLEIVKEFVESKTAKLPGRPLFNQMLDEIEAGKAQGILAWHPDRLARNSIDGGRIIYLVDTGAIRDLRFPTFRFEPTAQGKFMLSIAFSQSKYYVDNLSENIKRGIRQKLRNGIWPSCAPIGYLNDKANRCIVPDEPKARLVRKAYELYATGDYTLRDVQERINKLGLTGFKNGRLSVANYQIILKNPVYYGMIRYMGEMYEGKHEPIVSKRLFDEVQAVMLRKSKPKTPTLKSYRYRGLFRCGGCGCFITTETQKGHNYLRCTKRKGPCEERYAREDAIAGQIVEEIARVSVPESWIAAMLEAVSDEKATLTKGIESQILIFKAELSDCEARLDALLDMVLNKTISQAEYLRKKEALLNQKAEIREKLAALGQEREGRFEPVVSFLKEAKQALFLTESKNPDACRDFLKKNGSNLFLTDQRLRVEFKNPWKITANYNLGRHAASRNFVATGQNFNWRRGGDSNPRYGVTRITA
jgi:site-specific DNA recombinase